MAGRFEKEYDEKDVRGTELVYIMRIQPLHDGREPFELLEIETRAGLVMKPRDAAGKPQMDEEHVTMGNFLRVTKQRAGPPVYKVTSKIVQNMSADLQAEAKDDEGWKCEPTINYAKSLENFARFMRVVRTSPKESYSCLGREGLFVSK